MLSLRIMVTFSHMKLASKRIANLRGVMPVQEYPIWCHAQILSQRTAWEHITGLYNIMAKNTKKEQGGTPQKRTKQPPASTNGLCPIWVFSQIDRDGDFAFNPNRKDFNHTEVLNKIIYYSGMTWNEILAQTHDKGKTKHHMLSYDSLSPKAKKRLDFLNNQRNERIRDNLFSFALQNKLRIIGMRDDEKFYVLWYDPEHEVCPSNLK